MTSQTAAATKYMIHLIIFYKEPIHFFAHYYMNNIAKYQWGKERNNPL